MNNRAILLTALLALFIVNLAFTLKFYGYDLSEDPGDWNSFGGYIGGTLGPLLNFLTIVLLIKTFDLQKFSTDKLQDEVNRGKQQDKLRSFETHFFNMLEAQKKITLINFL